MFDAFREIFRKFCKRRIPIDMLCVFASAAFFMGGCSDSLLNAGATAHSDPINADKLYHDSEVLTHV